MVERNDPSDHAIRLADRHVDVAGRGRHGLALDLVSEPGREAHALDRGPHVALHRPERVAGVQRLDPTRHGTIWL